MSNYNKKQLFFIKNVINYGWGQNGLIFRGTINGGDKRSRFIIIYYTTARFFFPTYL